MGTQADCIQTRVNTKYRNNKNVRSKSNGSHQTVFYESERNYTLDMVLSINGIPMVALELKNQLTGQTVDDAKNQYIKNRNPREKCFQSNKRFLVYFAVDLYEAWMTTRLAKEKTYFLPLNQAHC